MACRWSFKIPNPVETNHYIGALGVNRIVAQALINRGMTINNALKLLNNPEDYIKEAYELININEAADLITDMLRQKEAYIEIFGDYDADGITSTAIAYQALYQIHDSINPDGSLTITWNIPERTEGYGLSKSFCKKVIKKYEDAKIKPLIITVDNGVTKKEEVKMLQDANFFVLITDHHVPDANGKNTPDCIVVDPKCDRFEVGGELAGCGVIWNILKFIEQREELTGIMDQYKYLMAIGTVGDIMKMTPYHIAMVKKGLDDINSKKCPIWLKMLKDICLSNSQVTSKDIGWTIAPMLNACAQSGHAKLGAKAILEIDEEKINDYVCDMKNHYEDIKAITKDEKARAEAEIVSGKFDSHNFIIYTTNNKHSGIAGKVASHISQLTNKPTIVITYFNNNEEEVNGSARNGNNTISMLGILKMIERENLIVSANGHSFACGCKLLRSKLNEAQTRLDEIIQQQIDIGKIDLDPTTYINIDSIISTSDINTDIMFAINRFPYAKGFDAPVVCINEAQIISVKSSSNNEKNICYTVKTGEDKQVDIWVWNKKPYDYDPKKHTKMSIVGNIEKDFRNPRFAALSVIDIAFF